MSIWHVENTKNTQLKLWRINSSHFRVIEAGTYEPILTDDTYTLMKKKYAFLFKSLNDQVTLTPTRIHDFLAKTNNDSYLECKVLNEIDPQTIHTLYSSGQRIWTCYGNLFVSEDLKAQLFQTNAHELAFSLGFSMFGGINPASLRPGF